VLLAMLICSDEACAEEVELVVRELDDTERAACDCGCTRVLVGVAEWSAPTAVRVPLLALAA
jgi:hypothetical protein